MRPGPTRLGIHHLDSLQSRVDMIVKLLRGDFYDPYRGPRLRALAGKIVKGCPVRGDVGEKMAGWCELTAVHDFMVKNVRYSGDTTPIGEKPVDLYQSPLRTLEMGIGDCDDISSLTIAIVTYLGYHAWLRVSSNSGDSWDHIYAVLEFPRVNPYRELVIDPTLGSDKLGREAPRAKYVDFYK